jgi:hypothetical protein
MKIYRSNENDILMSSYHAHFLPFDLENDRWQFTEKMQEFADKLIFCQEHDVQVTINMVMVPEWFEKDWDNALFFHEQGINVTLKPQSDPTASRIVDGYTDEMKQRLWNGMPQRAYTEVKRQWTGRPNPNFELPKDIIEKNDTIVPAHFQVEFTDKNGKKWYMDQAERFNAFNFNKFKGWNCNSGYQGIIIREPDGSIKRSYSCLDTPLGNIETGFKLFHGPALCITESCVSSADSKIPKRAPGAKLPLWPGDKTFES